MYCDENASAMLSASKQSMDSCFGLLSLPSKAISPNADIRVRVSARGKWATQAMDRLLLQYMYFFFTQQITTNRETISSSGIKYLLVFCS